MGKDLQDLGVWLGLSSTTWREPLPGFMVKIPKLHLLMCGYFPSSRIAFGNVKEFFFPWFWKRLHYEITVLYTEFVFLLHSNPNSPRCWVCHLTHPRGKRRLIDYTPPINSFTSLAMRLFIFEAFSSLLEVLFADFPAVLPLVVTESNALWWDVLIPPNCLLWD